MWLATRMMRNPGAELGVARTVSENVGGGGQPVETAVHGARFPDEDNQSIEMRTQT